MQDQVTGRGHRSDRQRGCGAVAVAAVLAGLICAPAWASDETTPVAERSPLAERGLAIARDACARCHILGDGSDNQTVPAGIPSLRAIANAPKQTADTIRGSLLVPHYPMPDTNLTPDMIRAVITYMDTLREAGAEPLIDRDQPTDGLPPKPPAPT